MKKIVFVFCLCLFGLTNPSYSDTIYAQVNADTATIWHKEYHTSCSSSFMMNFQLTDNHIILFEIDTSGGSYCLCYFDLYTRIGGLSAGIYTVDVYEVYWPNYPYSNYTDTTFLGNTTFEIEGNPPSIPALLSNNTSDCYHYVGVNKLPIANDYNLPTISVNPNPVSGITDLVLSIPQQDLMELKVLDETGKLVEVIFKRDLYKGIHHISWDASRLSSGLYLFQLSGTHVLSSQKVIVQ
jgi:hypothetical protein